MPARKRHHPPWCANCIEAGASISKTKRARGSTEEEEGNRGGRWAGEQRRRAIFNGPLDRLAFQNSGLVLFLVEKRCCFLAAC
jgi:hypothetical protein